MKKKWILVFLLAFGLLCSCGRDRSEMNSLKSTATINDFKFTLTAEKTVYTEEEVKEGESVSYKLEMEYTGEEQVTLWHGDPLGGFSVENSEGLNMRSGEIEDMLKCSFMEKDEKITVAEWTGEIFSENQELECGVYTVEGFVSFRAGEDYEDKESLENVECSLSLPLVIQ